METPKARPSKTSATAAQPVSSGNPVDDCGYRARAAHSYSVSLTRRSLLGASPVAGEARDFLVESRQDRLEEGVLHEPDDRRHRADLRIVDPPEHLGLGGHFLARSILEELRDATHDVLVHLPREWLRLVLLLVVDLEVLEQRLDVARDGAFLGVELGIQIEAPGRRVEAPVCAEEVVEP